MVQHSVTYFVLSMSV